ncbi:hypothetical protein AB8A05_04065 [Tardiphaga sp. 538_B7_N1_4]|uniref:hypothetical protein n=1 Tax=Tardiphaga sp. 538_B7_N1_4 TaxID=3240778 RepID=UPI003F2111CE
MGKPSKAIIDFMEKYKIATDEIWEVHGSTWVVKHKALERVAAELGVVWDRPAMIETNASEGIVSMCVFGKLGDHSEWSVGEASPKNNKNSYPYAMAEKRAKDRVILKLLSGHGDLYSEAEADEFEQPRRNPHVTRAADIVPATEYDKNGQPIDNIPLPDPSSVQKLTVKDQRPIFEALQKEIHATDSIDGLQAWAAENKDRLGALKNEWQEFLRGVYADQLKGLRELERGDDMRMAG